MTDKIKGFLVTLERECREDDSDPIMNALKMIRGVHSVKFYVKSMEDYMSEQKGREDAVKEIWDFLRDTYFTSRGMKK